MKKEEMIEHVCEAWRKILKSGSKYGKIIIDLDNGEPKHVAVEYNVIPDKYRLKEDVKKF